jgi:hypothetical protein
MKISEMIISAIIKKGILYEARNCDMDFDIPIMLTDANGVTKENKVKVNFKAEHMKLSIEKDEKA